MLVGQSGRCEDICGDIIELAEKEDLFSNELSTLAVYGNTGK